MWSNSGWAGGMKKRVQTGPCHRCAIFPVTCAEQLALPCSPVGSALTARTEKGEEDMTRCPVRQLSPKVTAASAQPSLELGCPVLLDVSLL